MPSDRHQTALAYARAGIPIFPVRAGAKQPLPYSNGFKDATTDEDKINAWFAEDDFNLALEPEQAGWCVVDLDGSEGLATWAQLCIEHGHSVHGHNPINTRIVATPSGGRHVYFCGSLPATVRKLGPGIDTRGRGSYVLIPPSIIGGIKYEVLNDGDISELPEWIEAAVQTEHERRTADGDYEADSPARVDEAKRRIRLELHYNGEAEIGAGSDDRAYKITNRLRDIGLSDPVIIDMLEALWAPHFDREWIESKVTNAEKYGQNERGSVHVRSLEETNASLLAYCQPAASSPTSTTATSTDSATTGPSEPNAPNSFARSFEAIRSAEYPPVEWVWQDRLLKGMANLYTGDAGAGKTTLAENIAVACACDVGEFLGAEIEPMPTLLLLGEDAEGQGRDNIAAIAEALGVLDHPGMSDIYVRSTISHEPPAGPRLAKIENGVVEWCMPFAEELAQFICGIGRPLLIVIDPVAEFVSFDHMNPDDCRALSMQFCRMLTRFGAGGNTVLMNDHPSKSSMASGHHYAGDAQLKAAVSLFATLLKGEWGGMQTRQRELTLSVQKARYAAESDTVFYRTALSPLFVQDGAPGEKRLDHMQRVYEHIIERLEMTPPQYTQRTPNKGDYPLSEVARTLDMSEKDVFNAVRALQNDHWLLARSKIGSGANYVPAHLVNGPAAPIRGAKPSY